MNNISASSLDGSYGEKNRKHTKSRANTRKESGNKLFEVHHSIERITLDSRNGKILAGGFIPLWQFKNSAIMKEREASIG